MVGHTHTLDWFTTFRLQNSARMLGYQVRFSDMRGKSPAKALREVDALLVPGGADINPSYYAKEDLPPEILALVERHRRHYESTREGARRDPFEYGVYRAYFGQPEFATLPALGICRGMQMMAVAKGIPLVLDIKAETGIDNRRKRFDDFDVARGDNLMSKIFPEGEERGYKNHHQNPRMDYLTAYPARHPDVKITATSQGGKILEAMELTDRPALGVQFHPELSFPAVKHRIFSWLLTSACERTHHGDNL